MLSRFVPNASGRLIIGQCRSNGGSRTPARIAWATPLTLRNNGSNSIDVSRITRAPRWPTAAHSAPCEWHRRFLVRRTREWFARRPLLAQPERLRIITHLGGNAGSFHRHSYSCQPSANFPWTSRIIARALCAGRRVRLAPGWRRNTLCALPGFIQAVEFHQRQRQFVEGVEVVGCRARTSSSSATAGNTWPSLRKALARLVLSDRELGSIFNPASKHILA